MGLDSQLSARLVMGENIAQTYQFVASGNAEVGFVALAQIWRDGKFSTGSGWRVPAAMHTALRQDAVLLQRGVDNPSAQAFLAFIVSPSARTRIAAEGYGLP
jgi:molybdate transport system substrate-binding protein